METLKELFTLLLGLEPTPENIATILGGAFFSFVGLSLNYLYKVKKGIKENEKSPDKFSLKYFFEHNWRDIAITLILIFVALRFTQELLGVEITMWVSFGIGFGIDKLQDILNKKFN